MLHECFAATSAETLRDFAPLIQENASKENRQEIIDG
jgi:hypothetical protein